MPYAKNGDINIYYEVEGEGPPPVMLHGLICSLEDIREAGYVDALKDDYQLILPRDSENCSQEFHTQC